MRRTNGQLIARFNAICKEIGVDSKLLLERFPAQVPRLVKEWAFGKINDLQLMREINSLAKCNPEVLIDGELDGDRNE